MVTPLIRTQPGFAGVTYLLDDTGDEAGLHGAPSLWRSRRDTEAAARFAASMYPDSTDGITRPRDS